MADTGLRDRHLSGQARRPGVEAAQSVFIGIAMQQTDHEVEYAAVCHDGFGVRETEHTKIKVPEGEDLKTYVECYLIERMKKYAKGQGFKIELVAVAEGALPEIFRPKASGLDGVEDSERERDGYTPTFLPAIWMKMDAVPFLMHRRGVARNRTHGALALDALADYAVADAIRYLHPFIKGTVEARVDPEKRQVQVDADGLVHLNDLQQHLKISSPTLWKAFHALATLHVRKGTRVSFFSATPSGGGVALMRHALVRLWRECGGNVIWNVPMGDPAVFQITKGKFHNVMQNKEKPGTRFTDEDKKLFEEWTVANIDSFWTDDSPFAADICVIDDPQLTACIPHIRRMNPKAKIIFRSHIQIESALVDKPGTLQHEVFNYLFSFIKQADLFVAHPVRAFVPKCVAESMPVVYMAPSTDPLDGLNKPLSGNIIDIYKSRFNAMAVEQGNLEVDWSRGYIVQVARFDPSKGYDDLVEAYRLFRERMDADRPDQSCPQLVLTGNSSIDDPDGQAILSAIHEQINHKNYKYRDDVITVRLPPLDQLLNTILRCAWLCCQVSTKEGFEVKVTEAIHKGVPVLVTNAGGIPLQVRDGIDGLSVEPSDSKAMADVFYKKATASKDLPEIFSKAYADGQTAADTLDPIAGRWTDDGAGAVEEYFTLANSTQWALLWARTLYGKDDLQDLDPSVVAELTRLGVGQCPSDEPYKGLTDEVVYSVIAGKRSRMA